MLAYVFLCAALQAGPSPYTLPIGAPGKTTAASGRITDLKTGLAVTADDIAKAADRRLFLYVGEDHATEPDQFMHAQIIEALVRRGRRVIVGMEMYQRPIQPVLDKWSSGQIGEADFISQSQWKTQWGYEFAFYRPVFDAVQRFRLPLVALNVPRDWAHRVAQGGFAALTPDERAQLPSDMSLDNADHRKVFDALTGGHLMSPNIYSAQVLWDEAMADTALKYLDQHRPNSRTILVVLAGAGHVMYGQGINYRVARRHRGDGITVVMISSNDPVEVANGLADFVLVSPH